MKWHIMQSFFHKFYIIAIIFLIEAYTPGEYFLLNIPLASFLLETIFSRHISQRK